MHWYDETMLAKPVPRSAELALGSAGSVEYIFYIFLIIFGVVIIASIVLGATLQPKTFDSIVGNVGNSFTNIFVSIGNGIKDVIIAIEKAIVSPVTNWFSSAATSLHNWWNGL